MREPLRRPSLSKSLYRWGLGAISVAGFAASSLFAADIPVTIIDDSGVGSLRQALASALSADTISFDSGLNGLTLSNGQPLNVSIPVTLINPAITLTDPHAYFVQGPLTISSIGTFTMSGVIGNGTTAGSLVSNGTGILVLSGANTYGGGTTITNGTVQVANSSALGTGAVTLGNNAKLLLNDGTTLNNTVIVSGASTLNIGTGTSRLAAAISGSSALTLVGAGDLTLSTANTFSGGLTISDASTIHIANSTGLGTGAVTVNGAATLDLANGVNLSNAMTLNNALTVEVDSGTAGLQGNITGANPLTKNGAGTLILSGTNLYSGLTTVNSGVLQGSVRSLLATPVTLNNGSTVVFNQLINATYAKTITGNGIFSKTGAATLTFSGTTDPTVTTTVSGGGLYVTGTINGPVGITDPSATLSGTGSVGSVVNGGVVEPGDTSTTIGTLTVNGDFTQLSSGTTAIKINSGGNTPGTNSDFLNVTGQAALDGSLKVALQDAGSTAIQYTLLNATSVNGKFTQFYSDNPNYGVVLTYDPTDVKFQLQATTDLRNAATTPNQVAVANVLENLKTDTTTSLYPTINMLGIESPAQQSKALTQLSGAVFGDLQTLGLLAGDEFHRRVTNRLVSNSTFLIANSPSQNQDDGVRGQSPVYGGDPTRAWVQGYGSSGNLRSDGNASGLTFNQGGGVYGYDLGEDESGCFGFAVGNSYARFKDDVGASGLLQAYQLGTYALVHDEMRYALAIVNYGYNQYSTNRDVTIADVNQTLHADYTGTQIGANVEAGLKYSLAFLQIQPLVGLQYLYLCPQGFTESGGNDGLTVLRSRANSLRAIVGGRLAIDSFRGLGGTVWTPYSHARFVVDMLDDDRIVNASFSGVPVGSAFQSRGTSIGQTYGILGEGLQVQLNETWSLFGGADVMFGDRISTATGSAGLMCLW